MKMFRSKSKLIVILCCFIALLGCGLKGPLYQTPEKPIVSSQNQDSELPKNKQSIKKQSENK